MKMPDVRYHASLMENSKTVKERRMAELLVHQKEKYTCPDCGYYPADCRGCGDIKGKVFWLEYTGESCCDIYECCINQRKYRHCGQCEELPCSCYDRTDPTKTKEEKEADHSMQMKNLREYRG